MNNDRKEQTTRNDKMELSAKRTILEELFQDFNSNRAQVYRMNFVRGLFFGLGSVLGGTILVALVVWLLTILSQHVPVFGDFFRAVSEVINQS